MSLKSLYLIASVLVVLADVGGLHRAVQPAPGARLRRHRKPKAGR